MKKIGKIMILMSFIAVFGLMPTAAEELKLTQPAVEYSADEVITTDDMTITSKVHYAPGKIRKDQNIEGMTQSTIVRQDLKVIWILMPNEMMYMEMPITEGENASMRDSYSGDFSRDTVLHEKLGEETVNGIKAVKNKVTVKDPQSGEFEGLMWLSEDGIIVKMETDQMTLDLKNIKMGKQDPQVFEVPAGYSKMGMPGMGGMLGSMFEGLMQD